MGGQPTGRRTDGQRSAAGTIVVVEDDQNIADLVELYLREEGFQVVQARDGEAGLRAVRDQRPRLVILDVGLPGDVDGLAVCRKLRADRKATPILMLTAREAVEDRVAGLDTGADDYLTKPFAFTELIARVRALLRRGSALPSGRLKALDLELDPVSHRVWRAGQEIPLTNKEFALLEYLLRNANQVLTRTAIIEHVWDIHYDSMTNIVDVHIRALRAKVDRNFPPPLIHTVRGVGYVLKTKED